jgi:hypothetical protein
MDTVYFDIMESESYGLGSFIHTIINSKLLIKDSIINFLIALFFGSKTAATNKKGATAKTVTP